MSSQTSSPQARSQAGSFRSATPPQPIHIEHQLANHPHLHIHTIRSPSDSAVMDDDISPPSSISAQILAPFLNAPVPSKLKSVSTTSQNSSTNGTRGASARANALGSLSRSSSVKKKHRRQSNEDSSLTKEFLDLIGDGHVDSERLDRMRCLARDRGIPSQLRKYVWPLFLSQSIRSNPAPDNTDADDRLTKISKRIRGELSRYHRQRNRRALPLSTTVTPSAPAGTPPGESSVSSTSSSLGSSPNSSPPQSHFLDDAPVDLAIESTIISFLASNPEIEFSSSMVYLCLTLAEWIFLPSITPNIPVLNDPNILLRNAFAGALSLFGQLPTSRPHATRQNSTISLSSVLPSTEASKFPANHRISQFLSAFRLVMPELARFFDDEDIGGWGDDWVGGWVGWFCAKEFTCRNAETKARLWDVYFSFPPAIDVADPRGPGEELHIYVCIALLKSCRDGLEVLEQSEIRTLLQQLPPVEDVEGILREAGRIRDKVEAAEKEEEEGYIARKSSGSEKSVS